MKRLSWFFITWGIIASGLFVFTRDVNAEYVRGEILVKFKDNATAATINNINSYMGVVRKKDFKKVGVQQIKLPDDMTVEEAIEYYRHDPAVEYAEPNYIVHAMATTPNDTSFSQLWGLDNTGQNGGTFDADIDAPEAWDMTTGSDSVVIAVIDSGVAYNHPDLKDNIWTNTGETSCEDGIDNDSNGYIDDCNGWDFLSDDNDPEDYYEHGTHVAGIIAAVGNNNEGVTGVMWQAKIMPLRFLGINGSGTVADAVAAILYANANGAHVINASWGGDNYSLALKDAIDASNAVVVCAAGNDGVDNDSTPYYPASYTSSNIITVAATDHNDGIAVFSDYGAASVDLAAPGVDIYSSIPVFSYGAEVTVYGEEDFDGESGDLPLSGWSRGGSNSTWAVTAGTGIAGTNSLEDSPAGSYADNTDSWAGYMTPIISEKDTLYTLTFNWKGYLEDHFDYLEIDYSVDGSSWSWVDYRTGTNAGFTADSTDKFTFIAEMYDSFYFGFGLSSDNSNTEDGVYIDDVKLVKKAITVDSYSYKDYQGTSMAAPYVSGVAGLIKAMTPGLSNPEIKDAIIKSVDAESSLKNKIYTGGRLNAFNAVRYSLNPCAPSNLSANKSSNSQVYLSWTDNCSNEDGFRIQRKTDASGTFDDIAAVEADTTNYADTAPEINAVLYYRVRSYGTSVAGDFAVSNEASAEVNLASPAGDGGGGGGSCFIATAAYGSYMAGDVMVLRRFRDKYLLTNAAGREFVSLYYRYSPPLADYIAGHEALRTAARVALTPLVFSIKYPFAAGLAAAALLFLWVVI